MCEHPKPETKCHIHTQSLENCVRTKFIVKMIPALSFFNPLHRILLFIHAIGRACVYLFRFVIQRKILIWHSKWWMHAKMNRTFKIYFLVVFLASALFLLVLVWSVRSVTLPSFSLHLNFRRMFSVVMFFFLSSHPKKEGTDVLCMVAFRHVLHFHFYSHFYTFNSFWLD